MDIHQKLVACSLGLLALTYTSEYFYQKNLMWNPYWRPIAILLHIKWLPYEPAIPTIIAISLLLIALLVSEKE